MKMYLLIFFFSQSRKERFITQKLNKREKFPNKVLVSSSLVSRVENLKGFFLFFSYQVVKHISQINSNKLNRIQKNRNIQ